MSETPQFVSSLPEVLRDDAHGFFEALAFARLYDKDIRIADSLQIRFFGKLMFPVGKTIRFSETNRIQWDGFFGYFNFADLKLMPLLEREDVTHFIRKLMKCRLVIPTREDSLILKGSAVIATEQSPEDCYYEGNANGASNLVTLWDRLRCATGRMLTRYPTTARMHIPEVEQHCVALLDCNFDEATRQMDIAFCEILDAHALEVWAEESVAQITGPSRPPCGCKYWSDGSL